MQLYLTLLKDPLKLVFIFMPHNEFMTEMFAWAAKHPGEHELFRIFKQMMDQGPATPYQRALVQQMCDCLQRTRTSQEAEDLTNYARARIALNQLKGVQTHHAEVQSAILAIMGMLME
jgi:hypothetical protein